MMVIEALIVIISICVLWTQAYMQDWKSVILFICIICLCNYVLKSPVYVAFGLAGILACLMNITYRIESYSNSKDSKVSEKKSDKTEKTEKTEEGDGDDGDNSGDDGGDDDNDDGDDDEEKEDVTVQSKKDNPIDMGETIKGALQNFDPKTLKNMTKDTTSLIKSQTELMNIIQQMQPVINKGLSLVDKFHGDGKTEKLFEQFEKLTQLRKGE